MGGNYFTWTLTEAATRQYVQAPNQSFIGAASRCRIQAGMVLNTAVSAEAGMRAPAMLTWVVFECGGKRYGVPLERVTEILPPRTYTRLPGTGAEVCGLAALRGRVVTVFDLGVILGLRSAATLPDHRLLLLEVGMRRIGAAVADVLDITAARVERAATGDGVVGIGQTEDATFTALDAEALLLRYLSGNDNKPVGE